jgi:hypothetical protein
LEWKGAQGGPSLNSHPSKAFERAPLNARAGNAWRQKPEEVDFRVGSKAVIVSRLPARLLHSGEQTFRLPATSSEMCHIPTFAAADEEFRRGGRRATK